MSSFNHEEFEAAKAAQRNRHRAHADDALSSSRSAGMHIGSEAMSGDATGAAAGAAAFVLGGGFRQDEIVDHPRIREELRNMNAQNTVDLTAFFQGAAGPADQRYLQQQLHASRMAMDPVAEVYHDNEQRRRNYLASSAGASSLKHYREDEPSFFFRLLRMLLITVITCASILYCSLGFLPSVQGTTVLWFCQVFCIVFAAVYYASSSG